MGEAFYSNADGDALVRVQPGDGEEEEAAEEGEEEEEEGGGAQPGAAGQRRLKKKGAGAGAPPLLLSECLHSCLDSIHGLAAEVDAACHKGLSELLRGHVYVGMVRGQAHTYAHACTVVCRSVCAHSVCCSVCAYFVWVHASMCVCLCTGMHGWTLQS